MPHQVPLALLRIRRSHLEVAVLEGTSVVTLNRAVGHIEETAMPGMSGNSGIAGHRDGFFRDLKDVGVGEAIELESATQRPSSLSRDTVCAHEMCASGVVATHSISATLLLQSM